MKALRPAILMASLLAGVVASAQEPIRLGPVYPIVEQDMREFVQTRLNTLQQSGELARLQQEAIARSKEHIQHPPRVAGITRATVSASHLIDASYVLPEDARDGNGRLLFAAGTRVNPLEIMPLTQSLLFIDGEDSDQVVWAKQQLAHAQQRVKLILVAGRPLDLGNAWGRLVFFDQGGALVRRFSIDHVPALVYQQGTELRVDEIAL